MKSPLRLMMILVLVVVSGLEVPAQTPATGRLMRVKLAHSQKILEAILTSDFALLDRESSCARTGDEVTGVVGAVQPGVHPPERRLSARDRRPPRCGEGHGSGWGRVELRVADADLFPVSSVHEEQATRDVRARDSRPRTGDAPIRDSRRDRRAAVRAALLDWSRRAVPGPRYTSVLHGQSDRSRRRRRAVDSVVA